MNEEDPPPMTRVVTVVQHGDTPLTDREIAEIAGTSLPYTREELENLREDGWIYHDGSGYCPYLRRFFQSEAIHLTISYSQQELQEYFNRIHENGVPITTPIGDNKLKLRYNEFYVRVVEYTVRHYDRLRDMKERVDWYPPPNGIINRDVPGMS